MYDILKILTLAFFFSGLKAQKTIGTSHESSIIKKTTIDPKKIKTDFFPVLKNIEIPSPDGNSYKSYLRRVKRDVVSKRYPRTEAIRKDNYENALSPILKKNFIVAGPYVPPLDTNFPITGGTPLDNTLAISNDSLLLISINSKIYAHDLKGDTALFNFSASQNTFSFAQFASMDGISTSFPFDPKLIYDPIADRFVIVFLSGRDETDSKIILGFSSSNNPIDPWHIYEIPGNPRNIANWSDYPAIAISQEELFITMNLLIPDSSWQSGFDGSIVWQINLADGYSGSNNLSHTWWDNIKYNGSYIRNLNPIQGGEGPLGPDMYFLSNRNFDISNDSIFVVHISDTKASGSASMTVDLGILDKAYGMPPNGRQQDTDLTDPSTGLQTNDSRWLGGFQVDNHIQFVGNTVDPITGNAAVYHGTIDKPGTGEAIYKGNIISDPLLDLGYPNIAFTGKNTCEVQSIIAFDHSSPTDFAGVSSIYYSNKRSYSELYRIKEGDNYVDNPPVNNNPYERWGDYFGIQRVYNNPGTVWTSGLFGLVTKRSSVFVAELVSPDTSVLTVAIDTNTNKLNSCDASIEVKPINGSPPYSLIWNDELAEESIFDINICDGTYSLEVIDDNNCRLAYNYEFLDSNVNYIVNLKKEAIFPNPFSDRLFVSFKVPEQAPIAMELYNLQGALVHRLDQATAIEGLNQFSFSTLPLQDGVYILRVTQGSYILKEEKLLKVSPK